MRVVQDSCTPGECSEVSRESQLEYASIASWSVHVLHWVFCMYVCAYMRGIYACVCSCVYTCVCVYVFAVLS